MRLGILSLHFKQLPDQVVCGARAGRAVGKLASFGFGIIHEFREGVGRHGWMDDDRKGRKCPNLLYGVAKEGPFS
jgi:hypothetical protein